MERQDSIHGDWQVGDTCWYSWKVETNKWKRDIPEGWVMSLPAKVVNITSKRIVIRLIGPEHSCAGVRSTTARHLYREQVTSRSQIR